MAGFRILDHTDIVLKQIASNAVSAMEAAGSAAVEACQEQMLYGYAKPPIDTGALFDSLQAKVEKVSQNTVVANVGSDLHYAGYVHNGTYKMAARPFVRDALVDGAAQDKIKAIIASKMAEGF